MELSILGLAQADDAGHARARVEPNTYGNSAAGRVVQIDEGVRSNLEGRQGEASDCCSVGAGLLPHYVGGADVSVTNGLDLAEVGDEVSVTRTRIWAK